jgi:hypothetical protein
MNFPAEIFCISPRALSRCRPCRASRRHKPTRAGRYAGLLALQVAKHIGFRPWLLAPLAMGAACGRGGRAVGSMHIIVLTPAVGFFPSAGALCFAGTERSVCCPTGMQRQLSPAPGIDP